MSKGHDDVQIKQFKGAFGIGSPKILLGKQAVLPSVQQSVAYQDVMTRLSDDLKQFGEDALTKRTGKKIGPITIRSKKKSSLVKVSGELGQSTVDLDAVLRIAQGKGAQVAQQALQRIKQAEDELADVAMQEGNSQAMDALDDDDYQTAKDVIFHGGILLTGLGDKAKSKYDEFVKPCLKALSKFLKINPLDTASEKAIRSAFVDAVYMPRTILRRGGKDPGNAGAIYDIVDQLLLIPSGDIVDEDLRDLVAKVQKAVRVTPNVDRAGKFSGDDEADEDYSMTEDWWPKDKKVVIHGNQNFRDQIKNAMDEIAECPMGVEFLKLVAKGDPPLEFVPPSVANANRIDGTDIFYSSSAGKATATIDPENDVVGNDASPEKLDQEKWRDRPAVIGMFHEMIHVHIYQKQGHEESWAAQNDPSYTLRIGYDGDEAELRIVGIDYHKKVVTESGEEKTYIFPWSDPAYNPISENAFRRAYAKAKGKEETYLRPYYANIAGQVKMPLTPTSTK